MARYTKKHITKFYKQGDYEKAYSILRDVIEDYPDSGGMYLMWAELEMRVNNNLSRAEHLLNEANRLGCTEDWYHRFYGDLHWRRGETKEALEEYEQCVAINPSSEHLSMFAAALSSEGDGRSVEVWQKVLQKQPKNCLAYTYLARESLRSNEPSKAFDMLKKAEKLKRLSGELLFEIGTVYHCLGDFHKALDYLLKAEKKGFTELGKQEPLYSQIANCYLKLDEDIKALKYAYKAVELEPKNDYAQKALSTCKEYALWLCESEKNDKAYEMMKCALEIWPDDGKLLAYMANLEMDYKHDCEACKRYMNKAFECNNTDLDLLYAIKGCLWFDCLDCKEEGLAYLEKAVSLNRNSFNLSSLAYRLMDTDFERAQRIFEQLYKSEPENTSVVSGLVEIRIRQDKLNEAFELAQKVYSLNSSEPRANSDLAYANFKLGKYQKALKLYLKAEELGYSNKAYIYNAIAECYQKLDRLKEAQKYLNKTLEIDPHNIDAKKLLEQIIAS